MKTNISENDKEYIISNNMNYKEISSYLNISLPTARLVCKKNGIVPKKSNTFKHTVNNFYFRTWSQEMAYFLGLLSADGYVSKQHNYFSINLIEKDRHILESMKKSIDFSGPIYKLNKKGGQDQACLRVASREIISDLGDLGLSGNKTYDFDWIKDLPEKYISHFVRGLFCGDGCIHINEELNNNIANLVGTYKLTENIKKYYNELCGNNFGSLRPAGNVQTLCFNGKYNAKEFLDWIYKDSTPDTRLSRKYDLYLRIKNDICKEIKPPRNSTITKDTANEMRAYYKQGKNCLQISAIYNVKESLAYDVIAGKSWVDSSYHYEKEKSDKIYITHDGFTLSLAEWSNRTGIPYSTLDRRYRQGLSTEQIFHTGESRLNLGKALSEKDIKSHELARQIREDYKNGIIGKANYEDRCKKSRYMDIILNRTNKEELIWWKE